MKNKRILSLVLAFAMLLGTFSFAFADEPASNPKIDWLVKEGLVKGDAGTGDLRLADPIKRSEVAAMVVRAIDKEDVAESVKGVKTFPDVLNAPSDSWANGYINVAFSEGIVNGYPNGTFKPGNHITKAEVVSMMVRVLGGLTEEEQKLAVGPNWATIYLAKAKTLGILDGVELGDSNAKATREFVFELVYNTLTKNEIGKYNIYKAIVLENDRVETLGKNEIVVEVIKEIQRAEYAKESRKAKGDQLRFELPEGIKDSEELLGKVVDIYVDRNDKLVDAKVDNSYDYVQGDVTELKDNKFGINWRDYTVVLDERYEERDDRVFRSYLNNKPYSYKDFAKKDMEYARATIKNGKVLFIDAFAFDDIAPVKEVKKDGAEVYVYNDARDGGIKKIEPKSAKVIALEKGEFRKATREDIAALDVLHVYDGGFIVRKDAKVDGEFKKVVEYSWGVVARIDEDEYYIADANNFRPVYSYDSKEFFTLYAKDAKDQLLEFKDEKVIALVDASGSLQYLTSEIELGEFVALIRNVLGKDARVVKPDNSKVDYTATFSSRLIGEGTTGYQKLSDFDKGDLVYLSVDDEDIVRMETIATEKTIRDKAEYVDKNDGKNIITRNYIVTDKEYKITNKTNVFVSKKDGTLYATTIEDVIKNHNNTKDAKAYILTDEAYNEKAKPVRTVPGYANVAHTIVFTDINMKIAYDYEIAEIASRIYSGWDKEFEVNFVDEKGVTRVLDPYAVAYDKAGNEIDVSKVERGAIVMLGVSQDDNKIVETINVLIDSDSPVFEVVKEKGYDRVIKLGDATGKEEEFWLSRSVAEFGNIETGAKVAFAPYSTGDKEITAIVRRSNRAELSYWTEPDKTAEGVVTYIKGDVVTTADDVVVTVTLPKDNTDAYRVTVIDITAGTANQLTDFYATKEFDATALGINTTVGKDNEYNVIVEVKKADGTYEKVDNKIVKTVDPAKISLESAKITQEYKAEVLPSNTLEEIKVYALDDTTADKLEIQTQADANAALTFAANATSDGYVIKLANDELGNVKTTWSELVNYINGNATLKAAYKAELTGTDGTAKAVAETTLDQGGVAEVPVKVELTFSGALKDGSAKVTIDGEEYAVTISSTPTKVTVTLKAGVETAAKVEKLDGFTNANGTPAILPAGGLAITK